MADLAEDFTNLMARIRQGDEDALAELLQRYEPEVRLAARVLLGRALRPHLDSVDLVQSVYQALMVGLREDRFEFAGPQQLIGLAVTMVRRKVARHWRHLQRQQRLETLATDTHDGGNLLTALPSSEPDPTEQVEHADMVERMCSQLDDQDRRLVELRLEGCSTAEAARRLGLDPDVLRVRLSRLRKRLRESKLLHEWL